MLLLSGTYGFSCTAKFCTTVQSKPSVRVERTETNLPLERSQCILVQTYEKHLTFSLVQTCEVYQIYSRGLVHLILFGRLIVVDRDRFEAVQNVRTINCVSNKAVIQSLASAKAYQTTPAFWPTTTENLSGCCCHQLGHSIFNSKARFAIDASSFAECMNAFSFGRPLWQLLMSVVVWFTSFYNSFHCHHINCPLQGFDGSECWLAIYKCFLFWWKNVTSMSFPLMWNIEHHPLMWKGLKTWTQLMSHLPMKFRKSWNS